MINIRNTWRISKLTKLYKGMNTIRELNSLELRLNLLTWRYANKQGSRDIHILLNKVKKKTFKISMQGYK